MGYWGEHWICNPGIAGSILGQGKISHCILQLIPNIESMAIFLPLLLKNHIGTCSWSLGEKLVIIVSYPGKLVGGLSTWI